MTERLEGNERAAEIRCHFGHRFRTHVVCVLAALGAFFAFRASAAQQEQAGPKEPEKKIRVLVLVDATKPLAVQYESRARAIGKAIVNVNMGIAPLLIESKISSSEQSKESLALQQTVGQVDRRPIFEAGIAAIFKTTSPHFEAVAPDDPSLYAAGKEIDFNKARADGYPYVLAVREDFAGMATQWAWGTLSVGSFVQYKLTDTATGKALASGKTNAFGTEKYSFDRATTDRSVFVTDYPKVLTQELMNIHGELFKQGMYHTMAESQGLGKEVPDLAALVGKYEKLFDYEFVLPKNWHQVATATKYGVVLEPMNADRAKFGVSFQVDLLVEEFGQKVTDLDDYIRIVFARWRDQGYAVDTANPFDALTLNPPYTGFLIDRPKGTGKEAILFRRLDDPFVVSYHIIFLEDYDGYIKKYGRDLEMLINQARITTHP